jgi:hypothetical protein
MATLEELAARVDNLTLELVAQRLVTRSVILYLLIEGKHSVKEIVEQMEEASDRTSVGVLPLEGIDPEVQRKASELARERGRDLVKSFGKVLATKP